MHEINYIMEQLLRKLIKEEYLSRSNEYEQHDYESLMEGLAYSKAIAYHIKSLIDIQKDKDSYLNYNHQNALLISRLPDEIKRRERLQELDEMYDQCKQEIKNLQQTIVEEMDSNLKSIESVYSYEQSETPLCYLHQLEISNLQDENTHIKEKCAMQNDENDDLVYRLDLAEQEIAEITNENQSLAQKNYELITRVKAIEDRCEDLQYENNANIGSYRQLSKRYQLLKVERDVLKDQFSKKSLDKTTQTENLLRYMNLQEKFHDLNDRKALLEKEAQDLQNELIKCQITPAKQAEKRKMAIVGSVVRNKSDSSVWIKNRRNEKKLKQLKARLMEK